MSHLTPGDFKAEQKMLDGQFTVRGDGRGAFDELVGSDAHFEMMSEGQIWLSLHPSGSKRGRLTMWITAKKGRLQIVVSDDE